MYKSPTLVSSLVTIVEKSLEGEAKNKARQIVKLLTPLPLEAFTEQCLRVALHLNLRSWTGLLSMSFSKVVRELVLPDDLRLWGPEEFAPELYDCPSLSLSERLEVRRRIEEEMVIMRELLDDPKRDFPDRVGEGTPLLLAGIERNIDPRTGKAFTNLDEETERFWLPLKLISSRNEKEKKNLNW